MMMRALVVSREGKGRCELSTSLPHHSKYTDPTRLFLFSEFRGLLFIITLPPSLMYFINST